MPGPTKRRFRNRVNVPANLYSPFQYTSPGTTISYSGVYPYTVNPLQYANNPVPSVNLAPLQQVNLSKMYGGRPVPTVNYSWTPPPVTQTPAQPRPTTAPVTQTPAPPYAYTPPPAWISSLYPNAAPQAAEPTPTAAPQAPTYAPVGSFERQTQLQNWFDWAAKQGKRPGWYGGAPGEGAYPTNLGDVLEGEQNWYYDPNYGNFIKNTGGSGAFGGKGNVKNNQYGADFQRRINEAWGKVGPEMEKLRRKRRMGQLPGGKNKNQPQQSSGKVAPAWVGGIGSFNV